MSLPFPVQRLERSRHNCSRRVGKIIAAADDEAAFERLLDKVRKHSSVFFTDAPRLVPSPLIINVIASKLYRGEPDGRQIIQASIFQLVSDGDIERVTCLSKAHEPYQLLGLPAHVRAFLNAAQRVRALLNTKGFIDAKRARRSAPGAFSDRRTFAQQAFGYLLYEGLATTDTAPGLPFEILRRPDADPRY